MAIWTDGAWTLAIDGKRLMAWQGEALRLCKPLSSAWRASLSAHPTADRVYVVGDDGLAVYRLSDAALVERRPGVLGGAALVNGHLALAVEDPSGPMIETGPLEGPVAHRVPLQHDDAKALDLGSHHTHEEPDTWSYLGSLSLLANEHGITVASQSGCVARLSADGARLVQLHRLGTHCAELVYIFRASPTGIVGVVSWAGRDGVAVAIRSGAHAIQEAYLDALHPGPGETGLISVEDDTVHFGEIEDYGWYDRVKLPDWVRESGSGGGLVALDCGDTVVLVRAGNRRMIVRKLPKPS